MASNLVPVSLGRLKKATLSTLTLVTMALASCGGDPNGTIQMPPARSTMAPEVDWLYYFIYWMSVVSFVLIIGVMMYFVIRYRRRPGNERAAPTGHNTPLEVLWTFSPLILLWFLFDWGFTGYMQGVVAPTDSREIRVMGSQWKWEFTNCEGIVETGNLTVPVGEPIKLIMNSTDVLHSFYIPEFRVKRDVVPGMYSTLWFEATQEGEYQVFCTEYCGAPVGSGENNAGHSAMMAKITVVSPDEYENFCAEGPPPPAECEGREGDDRMVCWGDSIFHNPGYACYTCHNGVSAPSFNGLWGREGVMMDGSVVIADENYIRESILRPQAKIVQGYNNIAMPPFRLSDNQLDAIIAYIKSLEE
ncbi:MAG: cytochrome c oxidase subunit II [Myxococcota bacterium]